MIDRRRFFHLSGALLVSSQLPRVVFGQTDAGSIAVGASLPLSGADAALGQEIYRVLYGMLGERPEVSLRVLDDAGSPERAARHYRTLGAAGVRVFAGVLGDERAAAATAVANELEAAVVLAVGTEPRPGSADTLVSLAGERSSEAGRIAAAAKASGFQSIALLYGLDAEGRRHRDAIASAFEEHGLSIATESSVRAGGFAEREPRNFATELRRRGTDLLVAAEGGAATARFAEVSRAFGWTVPLVCSSVCDFDAITQSVLAGGVPGREAKLLLVRSIGVPAWSSDTDSEMYEAARMTQVALPSGVQPIDGPAPSERGLEVYHQARAVFLASTAPVARQLGVRAVVDALSGGLAAEPRGYQAVGGSWRVTTDWSRVLAG